MRPAITGYQQVNDKGYLQYRIRFHVRSFSLSFNHPGFRMLRRLGYRVSGRPQILLIGCNKKQYPGLVGLP
jgi:hypothetical protein